MIFYYRAAKFLFMRTVHRSVSLNYGLDSYIIYMVKRKGQDSRMLNRFHNVIKVWGLIMDQLHILIVDDDRDFLESISEMVESGGYKTAVAQNGAQALQIFNEENIDLLLMDLKMPGMNGIETYKEIRKIATGKLLQSMRDQGVLETMEAIRSYGYKVPVIIVTAYANFFKEELEKIKSTYTIDIIQKPFVPEELLEKIGAICAVS